MSDTSGFIIHPRGIEARVSPSEAGKLISRFLQRNSGASMLLFLELPSAKEGYKDLYYLTGLTGATAMEIFGMDEEILTHDGLINWGFMIPSEKTVCFTAEWSNSSWVQPAQPMAVISVAMTAAANFSAVSR